MKHLTELVTIEKKITDINLSASDWQLFTASMDCTKAAKALNKAFMKAVNSGLTRQQAQDFMDHIMWDMRDFGAADSEPTHTLIDLLDLVYGEEAY